MIALDSIDGKRIYVGCDADGIAKLYIHGDGPDFILVTKEMLEPIYSSLRSPPEAFLIATLEAQDCFK